MRVTVTCVPECVQRAVSRREGHVVPLVAPPCTSCEDVGGWVGGWVAPGACLPIVSLGLHRPWFAQVAQSASGIVALTDSCSDYPVPEAPQGGDSLEAARVGVTTAAPGVTIAERFAWQREQLEQVSYTPVLASHRVGYVGAPLTRTGTLPQCACSSVYGRCSW
jgi:hypothetical protein